MFININYMYENIETITELTGENTVLDLKQHIFKLNNFNPDNQILLFYNKFLDNNKKLMDYDIFEKHNINDGVCSNYQITLIVKN